MAKYTSGRQKNLKVGLTSYSENKTSLEVVGKVGIGTTNATSSLYVVGDQYVTGVSTLGEVKISSGIITSSNPGVTTVTFVGNLTGTASTAGFAYTAYKLEGFDVSLASVGFASTASDVIGGIASVTQLYVSGLSTVGVLTATKIGIGTTNPTSELFVVGNSSISGIVTIGAGNTGVVIDGVSGIVTSAKPGVTTVTYFGDLKGNSDTTGKLKNSVNIGGVPFDGSGSISLKGVNTKGDQDTDGTAASAGNLTLGISKGVYFRDIAGNNVTTSNNFTFDGNNLKVSGITTVGGVGLGNIGIKIDGTTGIISSSNPGVTTVTYYGNLVGTAQVEVQNVTNTSNVIGGIASVTQLYVSGLSTVGVLTASRIGIGTTNPTSSLWVGGDIFSTGISTLGTIKIFSGIITSTTGTSVTFFGDFVGTASSAGYAHTAFTLNNRTESQFNVAYASTAGIATNAGYATTAGISTNAGYATTAGISTNVIGGIASVSSLFVNEIGISTLGIVKISSGIVTSTTGTAVTFYGNFVGTATSAGFAQTAFSLSSTISSSISVGFATTATNVIGGIASVTQLSVSGVSTVGVLTASRIGIGTTNATAELFVVGNSRISGIVTIGTGISAISLNGTTGIITASGVGTVTYFGDGSNLTGIKGVSVESQAQVTQPVFLTLAVNSGVNSIGISTTGSTALSFNPSTGSLGIGTTNPTSKLFVNGNSIFGGTGIVTAVEYNGNLRIGTPSGGFKTGAVGIITEDFTKDSINDINSILGKLVPKPPTTIAGVALTVTTSGNPSTALLCNGFTPTNNAGTGVVTPTAGTTYKRNTNNTVSSTSLSQYGPGDSGTVTALLNNTVGVGTTTLSTGSNNGTYGSLVISNDKDAVNSTRNTGIASGFYEIYDVAISNVPNCPDGFNCISIQHGANETSKTQSFWYEDGSTISAPILSTGTINTPSPSTHVVLRSSGIPHYTENVANAFTYVLTCQNASRDMYSNSTFCTASGGTSGLISPGNKTYVDFGSPTLIPPKDFGVGIGSTTLITQTLQNTHIQLASPVSFHTYTAQTPYGSAGITTTLSQTINIMGTTPTTSKIDEDNINVTLSDGGANTGPGTRTIAISGVDNPVISTPYSTSWLPNLSLVSGNNAEHEAVVVGGVLKHDLTNYTTSFLPSGPNYSGKSASQYFQFAFTRTAISKFGISVVGTYSSCWVCLPNHTTWKTNLSNTNGWANMFIQQPGTPANDGDGPGCAFGAPMIGIGGDFNCTFGSYSSTGSNGLILIRFKLDSGKSITSLTITNPTA
jgi:hypothetical protein